MTVVLLALEERSLLEENTRLGSLPTLSFGDGSLNNKSLKAFIAYRSVRQQQSNRMKGPIMLTHETLVATTGL